MARKAHIKVGSLRAKLVKVKLPVQAPPQVRSTNELDSGLVPSLGLKRSELDWFLG